MAGANKDSTETRGANDVSSTEIGSQYFDNS